MGKALFVTGTGTDVGKTFVTALIVKRLKDAGLDAGYYKADRKSTRLNSSHTS